MRHSMTWMKFMGLDWNRRASELADLLCKPGVFPPRGQVFAALEETSPRFVKVLILGQDPYHHPQKARGVAFGYSKDYSGPVNSSLLNIMKEIKAPEGFDTSLTHWCAQGVLLLNTRLTVERDKPMSHAGKGWEELIDELLAAIAQELDPVVVAWGTEAREAASKHPFSKIIWSSHPCKYSASNGDRPFIGSRWSDQVDKELASRGISPINWLTLDASHPLADLRRTDRSRSIVVASSTRVGKGDQRRRKGDGKGHKGRRGTSKVDPAYRGSPIPPHKRNRKVVKHADN